MLLWLVQTIKRKVMRQKPVRLPFRLTAIKPRKRFKALRKSYARKILITFLMGELPEPTGKVM
jgi:hypothetical protein